MKKQILTFTSVLFLCFIGYMDVAAGGFNEGNIHFDIISEAEATVSVSFKYSEMNPYEGECRIPQTATYRNKTYKIVAIDDFAFKGYIGLRILVIPEGVIRIGKGAFWGCCNLTDLTIPSTVEEIGSCAFRECSRLSAISLPDKTIKIGEEAFYNCTRLEKISLGNVQHIGQNAFYGCKKLKELTVSPNNSVYTVQNGVLFSGNGKKLLACPQAKSGAYQVPDGVETIARGAFAESALTRVSIPAGVIYIGLKAFYGCEQLTTVVLTERTRVGYKSFSNCPKLKRLTIAE